MADEYVPEYVDKKALVDRYVQLVTKWQTVTTIIYNGNYICKNLLFTDYAKRLVEQRKLKLNTVTTPCPIE